MENNLKKHILLKKLSEKLIRYNGNENKIDAEKVGLQTHEIDKILKIPTEKQKLILFSLQTANEIEPYFENAEFPQGYFITETIGIEAFNDNKYCKKNWDIILKWTKNFVQLFIPLASLTLAILVFSLNGEKEKKKRIIEINRLEKRIEILEKYEKSNSR